MRLSAAVIAFLAMILPGVCACGQDMGKKPASAKDLIDILRKAGTFYNWPGFTCDLNWVKDSDIPYLMDVLDSEEECAHVVQGISSCLPMKKSTVGHEAAYLIEGYFKHFYPAELSSSGFKPKVEEIRRWYLTWERLMEVAKRKSGNTTASHP